MNRRITIHLVVVFGVLALGVVPSQVSAAAGINPDSRSTIPDFDLDYCLEQSLGGPVTYPDDSDGDGWPDTCSVRISRRAAAAHQKALEALADQHRDAYIELVTQNCQLDGGCDIVPPPPLLPATHPTYWSGPIATPDFCSNLSAGGPVTYPYDSDGDGVADTCSLPTTRYVAITHQKALEALADQHRDAYIELVTRNCWQSPPDGEDEKCAPWLGTVRVQAGDSIQIRALGWFSRQRDLMNLRAARFAIEDYGSIHGGFTFDLGDPLEDSCNQEAGEQAGMMIAADSQVVGVIGPTCSTTATKASPLLSAAGMVLISFSNTSPALTSDLFGTPGEHYYPGYYRTAHNDIHQGNAVANFLLDKLNINRVAVIHSGDAYTRGLAESFKMFYEQGSGVITDFLEIALDETQLSDPLSAIASNRPEAFFLPVYGDLADNLLQQIRQTPAFDNVEIVVGDALHDTAFLSQDFTLGVYAAGPDLIFKSGVNKVTGVSGDQLKDKYIEKYGQAPVTGFWPHAYDATVLLLEAIKNASYIDRETLVIDRAAVRSYLNQVQDFQGITGSKSCDAFGDCGVPNLHIVENVDPTNVENLLDNVVYTFTGDPAQNRR